MKEMVSFNEPVLPSSDVLQRLDDAHESGFRAFLSSIRHDEQLSDDRRRASSALTELRADLAGNDGPDYDDPYVAAAYIVTYHLSHCILAYWSFKGLFARVGIPEAVYVFDVGAGTGAGRVGLAIALSELRQSPVVYFDSFDPSQPMLSAGNAFWSFFKESVPNAGNYICREFTDIPAESLDISNDAFRVVTGFHPSLPYNSSWKGTFSPVMRSIQSVLRLVSPNAELFTCHPNKDDALCRATGESTGKPGSVEIPSWGGVGSNSTFYTECAVPLGFEVAPGLTSVSRWSRYRFSPPKGVLLSRVTSTRESARIVEENRLRASEKRELAQRTFLASQRIIQAERQREIQAGRLAAERAEREHQLRVERERKAARQAEEERRRSRAEAERLAAERAERERQRLAAREREVARRAEEARRRKEARDRLWLTLDSSLDSGEVISAEVIGSNTGGILVKWEGVEGFVPFSHCHDIVTDQNVDLSGLVGRSFDFNVQEVERARNRFVLTRKQIREQSVRETLSRLTPDQILEGTVVRIALFGAFVQVSEGCEGLVHISELSRNRVERVSDVVTLNQQVRVRVLKVDLERNRLSLSIKDALPAPWNDISAFIQVGEERLGEVTNVRDFGLFVHIGEGLEGLVHTSQLGGRKIGDFQRRDKVRVEIIGIEPERKRIPLRLVAVGS